MKLSTHPCKFALKVSVKLATPPESLIESLQQTFNKFQGSNPKIKKNLLVFLKKVFIFLKTMFFVSNKCVFYFKKCFFTKIGFMHVIARKKIFQNNIPKEVETKLVVQSTLWAVIENMFFLVPWFAHK